MTKKAAASAVATPVHSASERFANELSLHNSAAIGVFFVRTSEPFDAAMAIRQFCLTEEIQYREWSILAGWQRFDMSDSEMPVLTAEPVYDLLPALMALTAPVEGVVPSDVNEQPYPEKCVYTMCWPHPYMKAIPQSLMAIGDLTAQLPYSRKRLAMIVPPDFEVPPDIAQMVPIIDFDLPEQGELHECYTHVVEDLKDNVRQFVKDFTDDEINSICAAGAGMTRREFINAVCLAAITARREQSNSADLVRSIVMKTKVEVVKRSEVLEVMGDVSMDDVGGLDEFKDWIALRAEVFSNPEMATAAGVDNPKGAACIGPPGTGKSLLAKAVGAALAIPIIKFDISRVFGSLVGESEGRVGAALRMLDAMAPCVAFVDEIDKAFDMNSGGGDGGTGKRVLGKVLTHMQESKKPIFWVVTANRTNGLPPELLRKGRLDEIFSVSTPNESERRDIFRIHLAKRKIDIKKVEGIEAAITGSDGYVGAEIEGAVKDAVLEAYTSRSQVSGATLVKSLETMKPLSVAFADQFSAMALWAEQNARPASREPRKTPASRTRPRRTPTTGARRMTTVDDDMAG